jgi:hypothetical protein
MKHRPIVTEKRKREEDELIEAWLREHTPTKVRSAPASSTSTIAALESLQRRVSRGGKRHKPRPTTK